MLSGFTSLFSVAESAASLPAFFVASNLDVTFRWLDILDKEYNIFTVEYTLENFVEDL